MLHHFKVRWTASALCLAALMALAPLPAWAQNRMNPKSVAVTSNAPVTNVEAVKFVGSAVVTSRIVPDPDFGRPSFVMQFDFTGVTGTGGGIRAQPNININTSNINSKNHKGVTA